MQVQTEKNKITFSCPKCTATLKVPMQLAGVSGPCPKCGGTIVAPRPKKPQQTQEKAPEPSVAAQPEPPAQHAPEKLLAPLPVTPRISVTHGGASPTTEKPAAQTPSQQVAIHEKPPRVEIEDLNEQAAPAPQPKAPAKAAFPQSFQNASLENEVDSFDDIEPETEVPTEVVTAPEASTPKPPKEAAALAPLPQTKVEVTAPAPAPKIDAPVLKEESSPKVEEPIQKEPAAPKAETTTQAAAPVPVPVPVPAPAPKPEPPVEEPRVTVTTLPAAQASPPLAPAVTPKTPQVSVQTSLAKPAEVKQASSPVISAPRIQRDGRNAAKTAAVSTASEESTETRPISPVTKPEYLDQQTVSPPPSAGNAAPQANQQASLPEQAASTPSLPRLDASLATKPASSPPQSAPAPVAKKPTGPTKINLPQLNNGQTETAQSRPAATRAPAPEPISTDRQQIRPPESQKVAENPAPAPSATAPSAAASPASIAPDPTAVPAMRRQVPQPPPQSQQSAPVSASPAQPAPASAPVENPEQAQPETQPLSELPPLRESSGTQNQSLQDQLAEAAVSEPDSAHSAEQPPQATPNTVRKFFPQRRQPTEEDRGLGNVILGDTKPAEQASSEPDAAFDELFSASNGDGAEKRKFGLFHAGIIGAVVILAGVAIILVGNAFGVFGLDENPTAGTQEPATTQPPPVDTDKPAVERPPEKEAIANPTEPAPGIVSTEAPTETIQKPAPATDPIAPSTTGIVTGSATGAPEVAQPSLPGQDFNSLKLSDGTASSGASSEIVPPAAPVTITETPPTIVQDDGDVTDDIKKRIEAASKSISTNPSTSEVTDAMKSLAPAAAAAVTGVVESAENTLATIPASTETDPTAAVQPHPLGTSGPTGEFNQAPPSAVAGPPAPSTFTPPSSSGSRLGKSRQLVETFLEAPTWESIIPYTYRADEMKDAMKRYYANWPYKPLGRTALKFEQMESDPDYGGPFWMYNVSTSEDSAGFPIVVRQEKDLLKVDWGIYAEFRDQLFVKFNNGEIAGQQKFKLIIEHLSTFYGADAEAFKNLDEYYVFRLAPPYGSKELEEVAFVSKTSPVGTKLNELVPLNSSPLAVTVELENQSFPHGINHLVITRVVTDGWFE